MSGVVPSRIITWTEGLVVPDTESVVGSVSGDDVDWDATPGSFGGDQWKQPVRCATTAAITIATALNAGDTIDGVTLVAGDRVLVKDQGSGGVANGIYVAGSSPERAADMDSDAEVLGAVVYVIAGTANAGTIWGVTNTTATIVDTDGIAWAEVGGGGSIPAGTYELAIEGGQSVIKAHGSMGSTETFDPTDGNVHTGTLNADCTVTLNAPAGTGACALELWLTQDGTGGWVITWPGSVTVQGTLDTTASTISRVILETIDGGTSWVATVIGGAAAATLEVLDEGVSLDTAVTSIDVVGAGVTATAVGHAVTITVPGASSPGGVDQHMHIVDEQFNGDGASTTFVLGQEAWPESVMAYVSGTRTPVTLGGSVNDEITFAVAPASGTNNISVDYAAVVA